MNNYQKHANQPYLLITLSTLVLLGCIQLMGCVSDQIDTDQPALTAYQESMIKKAPQQRAEQEGIQSLKPLADPQMPTLKIVPDSAGEVNQIQRWSRRGSQRCLGV